MPNGRSDRQRQEAANRLLGDLETAWLQGSDAAVSNLIDAGLREPRAFAWALAERVADVRVRLLLSVQRALVGATSPSLYGACADVNDETITLTFYLGADATDGEREDLSAVGAEVIGDFTGNFRIEASFREVDGREEALRTVGDWVYLQRGFATVEP